MKTIGAFTFPETDSDAVEWKPQIEYRSLGGQNHRRGAILAVAKTRIEGTWIAYIGVVEGRSFDAEYDEVLRIGTPVNRYVAQILFPRFAKVPYAK